MTIINPYTAKGVVATPPVVFFPVTFSRIFFHKTSLDIADPKITSGTFYILAHLSCRFLV